MICICMNEILYYLMLELYIFIKQFFVCIYVKDSKTNISILCIFLMYAKDDNKDNNSNNNTLLPDG